MTEKSEETIDTDALLKEEIIGGLGQAISDFQDKKISGLSLFAEASGAWRKANRNETLKAEIEKAIRRMRLTIHQLAPINISEQSDPVRQRYNPNYWLGDIRKEFKNEEEIEKFILGRTQSLKEFFENL